MNVKNVERLFIFPASLITIKACFIQAEKRFKLEQCCKSFKRVSSLVEHRIIHAGVKPYKCNECGKAFNCRANLMQHQKIHSGEGPFQCKQCGKAFTVLVQLTRHQNIRIGEKSFWCVQCGSAFTPPYQLTQHQGIHTCECRSQGDLEHPCQVTTLLPCQGSSRSEFLVYPKATPDSRKRHKLSPPRNGPSKGKVPKEIAKAPTIVDRLT
ncbi:Zinc finger protein 60 [Cricetulus griseus]|uniref:Zinc finger protein 60 n=1 Tax=Cricetulus griseus TaxID=10029 RepID=G3HNQ0_CRIGR|nr:Zinc finger protein 60 [Cricetulus griseus]